MKIILLTLLLSVAAIGNAAAQETPSSPGAKVYFVNLSDGDTVTAPFKVIFGLSGMGVAPSEIEKKGTGHHHLLIDRPPLGEGEDGEDELELSLPTDENHLHFGNGQTETTLKLDAGTHTLQLVLGDHAHVPHSPPVVSKVITITVK